ncbi:CRE-VPS-11 protein [Aphelenchoides avenae]|nr:CRE-VPS-11 protein [Aphelenchus avenae]
MSQVELGWRRFLFFDKTTPPDPTDASKKFYLKGLDIQCWATGDGFTLLGLPMGALLQITSSLEVPFFGKVHERQLQDLVLHGDILATVGEDEDAGPSFLKIWDLSRWEKSAPFCKLLNKVTTARKTGHNAAVAVSMTASYNFICVGFADTTVNFFYGDFLSEKVLKWKQLRDGLNALSDGGLVGLAAETTAHNTVVFVIAENSLHSYILQGEEVLRKVVYDVKGCDRRCWYYCRENRQLLVNNREMVYFYDVDACLEPGNEIGRCHALARGNDKLQVVSIGSYVALLTQHPALIPSATSSSTTDSMMSVLTIYDVEFRYIAFSVSMPQLCQIFVLDRELFVLNSDGLLSKLTEKPLKSKLDIVLKKNLYDVAIGLARRSNYPDLHGIHKSYGDYLYRKGDFENAVRQYIETIGHVVPSYVIKEFLDGTRVAQLSIYLEALDKRQLATGQHSIILLSSYVKTNASDRIGAFVENPPKHSDFDVDEAVKILRTSKYSSAAAKLARKCDRFDLYMDTLVEDLRDYDTAVKFLASLEPEKVSELLDNYGSALLEHQPERLRALLADILKLSNGNIKGILSFLLNRSDVLDSVIASIDTSRLTNPDLRRVVLEHKLQKGVDASQTQGLVRMIQPEDYADALRLAQLYRCPPLVIHILRSQKRMDDLLRYLLREGDVRDVMRLCDEMDLKEMWIDLVTHVSKREKIDHGVLHSLLERIKKAESAHPLVVLEVLSRMESLTVADIRDYVIRWLEAENETITKNENTIRANEAELADIHKEIDSLENEVQIFQMTKCSACDGSLQVPAVHFLCKHSYHLHCFESYSEGNDSCPACTTSRTLRGPKLSDASSRLSHQQFHNELESGVDVMNLVTEYIGRGVFDQ